MGFSKVRVGQAMGDDVYDSARAGVDGEKQTRRTKKAGMGATFIHQPRVRTAQTKEGKMTDCQLHPTQQRRSTWCNPDDAFSPSDTSLPFALVGIPAEPAKFVQAF